MTIGAVEAQIIVKEDSTRIQPPKDQIVVRTDTQRLPKPGKAALYSTLLPGLGQVYNRKYWKLPILYAGAFTLGYFIQFNHGQYTTFRDAFLIRQAYLNKTSTQQDKFFTTLPEARQLSVRREYFRRNRDLLIIISVLVYGLNIADAYVDAHLADFNIKDDLSVSFEPALIPLQTTQGVAPGLTVRLNFK